MHDFLRFFGYFKPSDQEEGDATSTIEYPRELAYKMDINSSLKEQRTVNFKEFKTLNKENQAWSLSMTDEERDVKKWRCEGGIFDPFPEMDFIVNVQEPYIPKQS
mmetsp:Transcript_39263/g.59931  ORF Transcript_39263/g.59931 Transcript_39263/m.59931 type:complete len:105 (+) Transcript_39263:1231-1545(+)